VWNVAQVFGALAFFAMQVAGFGLILWTWPMAGLALLCRSTASPVGRRRDVLLGFSAGLSRLQAGHL
jgi:hypothetical protein